jgi:hypothetical protein
MDMKERAKKILRINNYVEDSLMLGVLSDALQEVRAEALEEAAKIAESHDAPYALDIAEVIRERR